MPAQRVIETLGTLREEIAVMSHAEPGAPNARAVQPPCQQVGERRLHQETGAEMTEIQPASAIRGRIIRFTWTEGPTKGTTHEHVFHENGTVEWRDTSPQKDRSTIKQQKSPPANETPKYGAIRVADDIYAVSYLAGSGYTLTVVLNFHEHRLVGFASSSKEWYPVQGTFEVVK